MTDRQTTSMDAFIRGLCARVDDPDGTRSYTKLLRITLDEAENFNLRLIPNIRSSFGTVESNGTIPLPEDCIEPLHASRYVVVNGIECVYPLGRNEDSNLYELAVKPANFWACPETPEAPTFNSGYYYDYPSLNGMDGKFLYLNWWHGELYGYKEHRVFGYWSYDEANRQLVFQSGGAVSTGDTVVFKYRTSGPADKYKVVPIEIKEALTYRVLQGYWESTNNSKAAYYFDQFRRALRMYEHSKIPKYSMEDWLNAFKRGYSSAAK